MDIEHAVRWAAGRRLAALITLRADGRAQSSDVVYQVVDGTFVISITDGRAKTRNLRRDPRAVLHISEPSSWSYVSLDGIVELSDVATDPDDDIVDALVGYYRSVNGGEHDDWPAYRRAMVEERRLIATFRPGRAVGQVNSGEPA
jgi:PPOX class probable F420-dependent enzyme